jgi:hypothetical protein
MLADAPNQLTLRPQTTDREQALEWFTTMTTAGVEGLVIKALAGAYQPGRRGGQLGATEPLSTVRSTRPSSRRSRSTPRTSAADGVTWPITSASDPTSPIYEVPLIAAGREP